MLSIKGLEHKLGTETQTRWTLQGPLKKAVPFFLLGPNQRTQKGKHPNRLQGPESDARPNESKPTRTRHTAPSPYRVT